MILFLTDFKTWLFCICTETEHIWNRPQRHILNMLHFGMQYLEKHHKKKIKIFTWNLVALLFFFFIFLIFTFQKTAFSKEFFFFFY